MNVSKAPLALLLLISSVAMAISIVGHPVPSKIASGSGLDINFAEVPVGNMTVDRCDGSSEVFDVSETLDLIDHTRLVLPQGNICGVQLSTTGRSHIGGNATEGGSFSLSIATGVITLEVSPMLIVTGASSAADDIRFADADWVTASMLGTAPGTHVHVNPGHALHAQLRDALKTQGAVEQ